MKLSELIHAVWKDKRVSELNIRKHEVKVIIEVLTDHIVTSLLEFGKVKIKGLFTINVKKAKGRRIRNPQTGEIMYSKDYYKLGLEPSKRLKKGLEDKK